MADLLATTSEQLNANDPAGAQASAAGVAAAVGQLTNSTDELKGKMVAISKGGERLTRVWGLGLGDQSPKGLESSGGSKTRARLLQPLPGASSPRSTQRQHSGPSPPLPKTPIPPAADAAKLMGAPIPAAGATPLLVLSKKGEPKAALADDAWRAAAATQVNIDVERQKAAASRMRGMVDAAADVAALVGKGVAPGDGVKVSGDDGLYVSGSRGGRAGRGVWGVRCGLGRAVRAGWRGGPV